MTLHIFNCDNDLALANFQPGFTPPATIRCMMDELALLPAAWAEEGDVVCLSRDLFGGNGTACRVYEVGRNVLVPLDVQQLTEVRPWGWSPAVCHRLHQLGVPEDLLPSASQLAVLRRLSSRERAVELLGQMREEGVCSDFCSEYCTCQLQVEEALRRWPRTILKAPWSGSGKGIRYGQGGREDTLLNWCRRIIAQQGGVVVEPLYDKVHDLAMEFRADGHGRVTYQGLSLFRTHANGAYSGNLLMSEEHKQAWLARYVSPKDCAKVRTWLEEHLTALIGSSYRGYLGVDMMLVGSASSSSGNLLLHPMVEVNLRMTMGMVSVLLQQRQSQGSRGVFALDYFPRPEDLQTDNVQREAVDSRFLVLASGAHYRAYVGAE